MKIVIATGLFPPQIGGPAQYALHLSRELKEMGFEIKVVTYGTEKMLPFGIRHFIYMLKLLPKAFRATAVISMDPISVGLPASIACRLLGTKHIIRIGGDFLWETHLERTKRLVPLSRFYTGEMPLNLKERLVYRLIKWTMQHSIIVSNSAWLADILSKPYGMDRKKIHIIENFCGPKVGGNTSRGRRFIWATRQIQIKNGERLKEAFARAKTIHPSIELDSSISAHEELIKRIQDSYAVILPSVSDVNPNLIYDSIRCNKPFIVTRECGLPDDIKSLGILVDPMSVEDIERGIIELLDEKTYESLEKKIASFTRSKSWKEIASDFLRILRNEQSY